MGATMGPRLMFGPQVNSPRSGRSNSMLVFLTSLQLQRCVSNLLVSFATKGQQCIMKFAAAAVRPRTKLSNRAMRLGPWLNLVGRRPYERTALH